MATLGIGRPYPEFVVFKLVNRGERPLRITQIGWKIGLFRKRYALQLYDQSMSKLPVDLGSTATSNRPRIVLTTRQQRIGRQRTGSGYGKTKTQCRRGSGVRSIGKFDASQSLQASAFDSSSISLIGDCRVGFELIEWVHRSSQHGGPPGAGRTDDARKTNSQTPPGARARPGNRLPKSYEVPFRGSPRRLMHASAQTGLRFS